MKVHYDTEFWERGPHHPIELISIGMVRETGESLYLVNGDAPIAAIAREHPWLRDNVLNQLPLTLRRLPNGAWDAEWSEDHPDAEAIWTRAGCADQVKRFLQATPDLELWAWYGAYDHVVLAQLFGRMIDLPAGVPMWTNDLRQEYHRLGLDEALPAQPNGEHNALADARHNQARHLWLAEQQKHPVLDLAMAENDADATTIRDYLTKLLGVVWNEGEGFSGKRPFGNSSWEHELYLPLLRAGLVDGQLDDDGYIERIDNRAAEQVIADAIRELGARR